MKNKLIILIKNADTAQLAVSSRCSLVESGKSFEMEENDVICKKRSVFHFFSFFCRKFHHHSVNINGSLSLR